MWSNFEEFCAYMYQENIIERKGINDFEHITYKEYKKNNFNFLLSKYCQQLVQAV